MKRFLALMLAAALLLSALPLSGVAETYYVYTKNGKTLNLRDEYTNKVIGHIPYGAALEPDPNKSTEISAYVTYKGLSGFAKWEFLQKTPPKARATAAPVNQGVAYDGKNGNTPYQGSAGQTSGFEITAQGAYIQYADGNNKGSGQKWETVKISSSDSIVITADVPRGKKIDYWVINGVRYDFSETVKNIRLTKADSDFEFEVVYTKSSSQSLIAYRDIQAARDDSVIKEIKTIHAQLCHVNERNKGAGGWITSFDFTNDYVNRATGSREDGGQVTARVKATAGKNQKVRGWKFNETELYPNSTVTNFLVRTLNTSMTYEPIFKTVKPKVTPAPSREVPPRTMTRAYLVTCKGCTFSGGGFSNATTGYVKEGTTITVTNKTGSSIVAYWTVNGSDLKKTIIHAVDGKVKVYVTSDTITRTINKDTTIVCHGVIN